MPVKVKGLCTYFMVKMINVHYLAAALITCYCNHNHQKHSWIVSRFSPATVPRLNNWLETTLLCRRPQSQALMRSYPLLLLKLIYRDWAISNMTVRLISKMISYIHFIFKLPFYLSFCLDCVSYLCLIEQSLQEREQASEKHTVTVSSRQSTAQWVLRIRQSTWNDQKDLKVTLIYKV